MRALARLPAQPATAFLGVALGLLAAVSPIIDALTAETVPSAGIYDDADADTVPGQAVEPVLPVTVAGLGRPDVATTVLVAHGSAATRDPGPIVRWSPRGPPAA